MMGSPQSNVHPNKGRAQRRLNEITYTYGIKRERSASTTNTSRQERRQQISLRNDVHDKTTKAAAAAAAAAATGAASTRVRVRPHQREPKQHGRNADSATAERQSQKGSIKGRKANAAPTMTTTCPSNNDDSGSWISDSLTPLAKHRQKAGDVPQPTQECSTVNLDDLSEPSFEEMDRQCETLSTASSAKLSSTAGGQQQEDDDGDDDDQEELFGRTYEPVKLLGRGRE